PLTCASLRVPGGMSPTAATTCLAMLSAVHSVDPVERLGVAAIDLVAALLAERRRQRQKRIVEVPVRVVAGEQNLVPADPLHHVETVIWPLRLFHRLGRPQEMLTQISRRRLAQMGALVLHALPVLVEPPAERGYPGETRLDQHNLQIGIALEHAFND